jgi:hypothetical protein
MNIRIISALFVLCCSPLLAQVPASPKAPESAPVADGQPHSNELGFTYSMPSDWDVQDTAPMLPVLQQQAAKDATHEQEKKDVGCLQIPLKATHGDRASSVVVVGLSYACIGQHFADSDLAVFGAGVAQSLKKTWTIIDPVYGAYTLGTHSLWIERASGNPIAHPESRKTLEIVCSMLKNGAVCWMAFVASDADLLAFEQSRVSLHGEPIIGLVSKSALAKKP